MPTLRTQQIDDVQFLGGIFVEVEQAYNGADYGPALEGFFPKLEDAHSEFFAGEHSPAGEQWPALSPVTIAKKGHDIILVETGALEASLAGRTGDSIRQADARGALFGTSAEKSIFHTVGGPNLPQREHVGMNDELVDVLADEIANSLVEQLKG